MVFNNRNLSHKTLSLNGHFFCCFNLARNSYYCIQGIAIKMTPNWPPTNVPVNRIKPTQGDLGDMLFVHIIKDDVYYLWVENSEEILDS